MADAPLPGTPAGPFPGLDAMRVARRQLHMLLLLDCSGSMRGSKMASLNYAMRAALPALREVADDNPEVELRMRVLRFATRAGWHLPAAVPVDELEWPQLVEEKDGETAMGEALALAASVLTPEAMPGRQLPAVVVLASDGQPSDDFDDGLRRLLDAPYGKGALRIAIAIGTDADHDVLERFIAHPPMRPLQANNAEELARQIKWATTAPVRSVSAATNAPDPVAALARDAELRTPANSELVW